MRLLFCCTVGAPVVEIILQLRLLLADQISFNEAETLGDEEVRDSRLIED